jgi:hypothetical protein
MLSKEQLQDASKCRQNDYCMINDRMCYMNEDGEVCDYGFEELGVVLA